MCVPVLLIFHLNIISFLRNVLVDGCPAEMFMDWTPYVPSSSSSNLSSSSLSATLMASHVSTLSVAMQVMLIDVPCSPIRNFVIRLLA